METGDIPPPWLAIPRLGSLKYKTLLPLALQFGKAHQRRGGCAPLSCLPIPVPRRRHRRKSRADPDLPILTLSFLTSAPW